MFPVAYLSENKVLSPAARPRGPVSTGLVKMGGGGVFSVRRLAAIAVFMLSQCNAGRAGLSIPETGRLPASRKLVLSHAFSPKSGVAHMGGKRVLHRKFYYKGGGRSWSTIC
jgi:hypothetical protein